MSKKGIILFEIWNFYFSFFYSLVFHRGLPSAVSGQ
jgi:hypothetical protein